MEPVAFKPERTSIIAVIVLFLGALPVGLVSPLLTLLFLVPIGALVWVIRAKVIGSARGVVACNGLGTHRVEWAQVDRFDIPKRGPVVLHRLEGRPVRLTALPRNELPKLLAAAPVPA